MNILWVHVILKFSLYLLRKIYQIINDWKMLTMSSFAGSYGSDGTKASSWPQFFVLPILSLLKLAFLPLAPTCVLTPALLMPYVLLSRFILSETSS